MAALLLLAACGTTPVQIGSFRLQSSTTILESRGLDGVLVAAYTADGIEGASAFSGIEPGFRSMVESRSPQDHPLLAHWQERLAQLQSIAQHPDATAMDVAWAGSELPFQAAVDDAVITLIGEDSARAAAALDCGDRLGVGRAVGLQLLETALRSPEIEEVRTAEWMRSFLAENNHLAVLVLARSTHCGEAAATTGMVLLDHLRSRDRAELYGLFATLLASEPDRADLLVDSLGFLPRHQRGPAASQLLSQADGSAELHRVITTRFAPELRELFFR